MQRLFFSGLVCRSSERSNDQSITTPAYNRSFLSLVSYATNSDLVTVPIPRDCQLKSFKTQIKGVLLKAGVDGDSVVVVFDDCHMRQPEFVEIVNTLLNGADLAGLIAHEEQARKRKDMRVCVCAHSVCKFAIRLLIG